MDTHVPAQVVIDLETSVLNVVSPEGSLQQSTTVGVQNGDTEESLQVHVHGGREKVSLLGGHRKASKGGKKFQDVFEMGVSVYVL